MRTDAWIFFIAWLSFPVGINKMLFDGRIIPQLLIKSMKGKFSKIQIDIPHFFKGQKISNLFFLPSIFLGTKV